MGTPVVAPAPPLNPELINTMQALSQKFWPGVPVIPTMTVGATDARFLNVAGIWTYGVSGLVKEADGSGIHGLNERLRVKSLYEAQRFLDELTRAVAR
jgi:acetylornithine deacetylase/succinyl-diaminopimelate desuccinylase-like protein